MVFIVISVVVQLSLLFMVTAARFLAVLMSASLLFGVIHLKVGDRKYLWLHNISKQTQFGG